MMQSQVQGSNDQGTMGPSILPAQSQQTGSRPLQSNIDLNVAAREDNQSRLSLDLLRTGSSSSGRRIPTSGGSSIPVMIHSGSAGYVVEESFINREGVLTNGQARLLCKRRASEVAPQPTNNVVNTSTAASSSNNGIRSVVPAATQPNPIQVGQIDNFQRNTRMRTIVGQQYHHGQVNSSGFNNWNNLNSYNVQQQQQATGHQRLPALPSPLWGPLTTPQMPVMVNQPMLPPPPQTIIGVPHPFQAPSPQLSSQYWNGPTMSSFGSSHVMIPTPPNMQPNMNLVTANTSYLEREALMQPNMNLVTANTSYLEREALMQPQSPFSSMGYPPTPNIVTEQITQRLHYEMGTYSPQHLVPSPIVQDMDLLARGGNPRQTQFQSGAIGRRATPVSRTVLPQFGTQRRRRLITQLRNYLRLVHRTGSYDHMEDAMILGSSVLNGINLVEDSRDHRDVLLDVDNMSYEELLYLEEQIGNVSTGLSQQTIRANLRRRKYQPIISQPPAEPEPCCICQEDYVNGAELGKLDCGHDFHFNCIKRWLVQKNLCPVCKKIALAI